MGGVPRPALGQPSGQETEDFLTKWAEPGLPRPGPGPGEDTKKNSFAGIYIFFVWFYFTEDVLNQIDIYTKKEYTYGRTDGDDGTGVEELVPSDE